MTAQPQAVPVPTAFSFEWDSPEEALGFWTVVGAKVATSLIQDGQTITVDGDAGTVKLET